MEEKDLILALDIGTTNIKLAAVDKEGEFVCLSKCPLRLLSKNDESIHEICPKELWSDIGKLFREVCDGLGDRVAALGISTHRGTFITWEQGTENYLHNFISWSDTRCQKDCDEWNNSKRIRFGQGFLRIAGSLVGSRHMVCAGNFQVKPANVQARLKWVMENVPKAKLLYEDRKLCFGTLDTWLIYKLTGGATWATDYTNAAATGIYDLWACKWCPVMTKVFANPIEALPPVLDCNSCFGTVSAELNLGFSAPILGVVADQQASLIGNKLFCEGDTKLTLGTSLACDRVTGSHVHHEATEAYPQIAWKLAGEPVCYMAESMTMESRGKYLDLLVSGGVLEKIEDADKVVASVKFSELNEFSYDERGNPPPGFPSDQLTDDPNAKVSLTRAVLDVHAIRGAEIVYKVAQFYGQPDRLIVDGGASASTYILECLASLAASTEEHPHFKTEIYKSECRDGSILGAYYMAGLGLGRWASLRDIDSSKNLVKINPSGIVNEKFLKMKFIDWIIKSNLRACGLF